jgi:hypothetical protein
MEKRSADALTKTTGSSDFVTRKRTPSLPQLFINCFAVLVVSLYIGYYVYDRLALTSLLFILGGGISWYVTKQVQLNRDLVQATEFQNALIASALGIGHKFCIIVQLDGTIFYLDRPFQSMFPEFTKQPNRALSTFLEHAEVAPADRDKILGVVAKGGTENMVIDMKKQKIALMISPIPRPNGFILMIGKAA